MARFNRQLATGNSRLVFAISTAFAPTLAKLVGEDSGGFHFRGASSSGKALPLKWQLQFGEIHNLIAVYGVVLLMGLKA
jgi:uncharacterized protein (DUF927 family)